MGTHFTIDGSEVVSIDPLYYELFKDEIKREIVKFRDKLDELERRIDDPYG